MSQGNGEIIDTPNEVYLDQYYAAREAIDRKALIDRAVRDVFRLNPAARAVCEYSLAEGLVPHAWGLNIAIHLIRQRYHLLRDMGA